MNLHVFNDRHGFFLNLTVKRFQRNEALDNNVFVNLTKKTVYKDERIKYLRQSLPAFRHYVKTLPEPDSVTFYPLDFVAAVFLKELKKRFPAIIVRWVFWGYEFYLRPDRLSDNYENFAATYNRGNNSLVQQARHVTATLIKRVLMIPVFNKLLLLKSYEQVHEFYSFLPQDYKNVFNEKENGRCEYHPISFLSIDQINRGIQWGNLTEEIMVGHSASPTLNHAEVLDKLSEISHPAKLFLPMEYGDLGYREEIKAKAKRLFGDRVSFLEKRMTMPDYYERISTMGFAVFNFRWQESLGNILFLAWNGTKIFLRKESSVYRQCIAWGLRVFTIEEELDSDALSRLLPMEQRLENKAIIERLFSREKVKEYWERLMLPATPLTIRH